MRALKKAGNMQTSRLNVDARERAPWGSPAHTLADICAAQIPRLYDIYKAQGLIDNFEQLLDNIFTPLFEVTVDPNSPPQLHLFLKPASPPLLCA